MFFLLFTKTIGLVLPMEHTALNDIVRGFKKNTDPQHKVIVKNAMGDPNLQRSIIKTFADQKVDALVTVGTATTQMAAAIDPKHTVGLASHTTPHVPVLEDEISSKPIILLIKQHFPHIKTIALVHSYNEKILPEVEATKKLCAKRKLNLQIIPVYTTQDLYAAAKHIKSDAILILKDHMVVSGVTVLVQSKLPIFASDEGSVKNGALCAIGVAEESIGKEGAQLVAQKLNGKPIPATTLLKSLKLFTSKQLHLKTPYEEICYEPAY